nr:glycosyltransferase [Microbacterium atlanticum]
MPRISILMPVRDAEDTVRSAASSTLRALPQDAELVVIDDASRDGTQLALSSVHDSRLRVITREESGGVASALSLGLESTSSEFVGRMDADDVSLPWRFRYQMYALKYLDVVFTGIVHFGSTIPRPTDPIYLGPRVFNLTLAIENPFSHPTMLARRSAIESVGGYREVLAEDYDLWLRIAAAGSRMCRLPLPALMYRHHVGQVTKIQAWRKRALAEPALRESYERFAESLLGASATWYQDLLDGGRSSELDGLANLLRGLARAEPRAQRSNLDRRIKRQISQ